MNLRKRVEKLELPMRKLRKEEAQLEKEAMKAGFTLKKYRKFQCEIAAISTEELIKLTGMSSQNSLEMNRCPMVNVWVHVAANF